MKIVQKTEYIPKTVTKYIAKDGKEFDLEYQCREHEMTCAAKDLIGVMSCDALDGYANFDGGEHGEDHDYRWFYPQTLLDVDKLRSAYSDELCEISDDLVDTWICLESNDYGEFWVTTLENGIHYAKRILEKLGYEMTVTKKGEKK